MLFSGKGRRARLIGVVLGTAAVVSACGGQQSANPPPVAPPPATVTVPGPQAGQSTSDESAARESTSSGPEESTSDSASGGACRTDQLRARFYPDKAANIEPDPSDPTREHVELHLANVGSNPCELQGSVRLEFTGAAGDVLASRAEENPAGPSGGLLELATREAAVQDVWWQVSPDPCIDPAGVRVYPPGASEPIRLPWHLGAVCDGGRIEHGRLFAG